MRRDRIMLVLIWFVFLYGGYSMWRDFRGSIAYATIAALPWPEPPRLCW